MEKMQYDEFKALIAKASGNGAGLVVPVYRRVLADLLTPVNAYLKISTGAKYSFLLESVEGGERFARYSFLGSNPRETLRTISGTVTLSSDDGIKTMEGNGIAALRSKLAAYTPVEVHDLPPFCGGGVGYLSYDFVKYIEKVTPRTGGQGDGVDDLLFAFYPTIMAFDHFKHQAVIISNVFIEKEEMVDPDFDVLKMKYEAAVREIEAVAASLDSELVKLSSGAETSDGGESLDKLSFMKAVEKAKELIVAGEIFQVVLSRSELIKSYPHPFQVYRALRTLNPSPYLFFLQMDDISIAGSSPEMLVKVQDKRIQVRPIAGTRRRGVTRKEDEALEEELRRDDKERAEHAMLVDLGRNDVGKVAEYGSVEVKELMVVERYSHVMHLVSRVAGILKPDCDSLDALVAAFPAGTVTGAPKKRAMEIISELEPVSRGLYAGAVGYIDYSGNIDTCITIRTIIFRGGNAILQAGAGIVYDSVPEKEYEETQSKAMVLREAIEAASRGF